MVQNKVLVILGPTAIGKSDLAVKLAKKLKGEIVSADSRQVYRGLDVGSGKITKKEMGGIPHYLLDVAHPKKRFSVYDYKTLALEALQNIVSKNKLPIVVGGTGMYIDALSGRITFPGIPPNEALRKKLEKMNADKLFRILKRKDFRRAQNIDPKNKRRLVRALEIVESKGKVPSQKSAKPKYKFIFIGLRSDQEILDKKIRMRLRKRLSGIIRECRKLRKNGLTYKRMIELGLEYKYAALYLQKKLSREEMEKRLYTEIRRYSKRQMTWFKRNKKIKWFTLSEVEGFDLNNKKGLEKLVRIEVAKI